MELFTIVGTIACNINSTEDDLDRVANKAEETGDSFDEVDDKARSLSSGGFSILKGAAANLIAEGFQKLVSAMGGLISSGVDYSNQIEQYQTSFETMTGSAEEAASITERLQEIGASTPFELTNLADTTQLLMNYGFTADDAISKMTMLGDISQGNSDKMTRIASAYGQMSSAGKVSLEDIKQMIEAGFNPLQEISDSTGESMESLYARISDGTLSIEEITASMERSTSEGGKYFGAMDAQSETFNGRLSTLKDTANESIGNILGGLLQKAADEWIPALTEAVSTVDEKFQAFMTWISDNQGLLIGIAAVIGVVTTALGVQAAVQGVKAAMNAAEVTSLGGLIAAKLADAAATMAALAPYLLIVAAIAAVIAIIVICVKHWDEIKAKVSEVVEAIKLWVGEMVEKITTFFTNLWNSIVAIFTPVAEFFSSVFSLAWTYIQGVWNSVTGYFSAIWETIKGIFAVVSSVLSGNWSDAWAAIQAIIDTWADYFSGIWENIKAVFAQAVDVGTQIVEDIKTGISNAWAGIVEWFNGLWDNLFGGRSVSVSATGSGGVNGSHASGLDYVPFDGYIAELHKGEMVLPANQADYLRRGATAASNEQVVDLLEQILDAVQNTGMTIKLNNREFGRAVRGYV